MKRGVGDMRLQVVLTREQAQALLESEIAELPDAEQWRIRGHGSRTRDYVRCAIQRKIEEAVR